MPIIIENNKFINNGGDGIRMPRNLDAKINNNEVYGNGGVGINIIPEFDQLSLNQIPPELVKDFIKQAHNQSNIRDLFLNTDLYKWMKERGENFINDLTEEKTKELLSYFTDNLGF